MYDVALPCTTYDVICTMYYVRCTMYLILCMYIVLVPCNLVHITWSATDVTYIVHRCTCMHTGMSTCLYPVLVLPVCCMYLRSTYTVYLVPCTRYLLPTTYQLPTPVKSIPGDNASSRGLGHGSKRRCMPNAWLRVLLGCDSGSHISLLPHTGEEVTGLLAWMSINPAHALVQKRL